MAVPFGARIGTSAARGAISIRCGVAAGSVRFGFPFFPSSRRLHENGYGFQRRGQGCRRVLGREGAGTAGRAEPR